jgi:hypothetical protein
MSKRATFFEAENPMNNLSKPTEIELEAAAFRRLVAHLRDRPEVKNRDLMKLAAFCRECLSNWYEEAATERGVPVSKAGVHLRVYGMSREEWIMRQRPDSELNPDRGTPDIRHDGHEHGADCGHEAIRHGDHTGYPVSGQSHHSHSGHGDDHGPVPRA